jgi:membrane-bound lytic murein transglycosylase D
MPLQRRSPALLVLIASVSAACASASGSKNGQIGQPTPAPVTTPPHAATPAPDPVQVLITDAERRFEDGRRQLAVGHLTAAKAAFNASLELLLQAPAPLQADTRLRTHVERLVDRIAALELSALATGDGFTERASEPASIDQLLAISTFDATPPTPATVENVQADLQHTAHDLPIPFNERVLQFVELFRTRLREFLSDGLQRGTQYLPMIQSVFRAEGLPLDLAYVPLIESAFKPTALSRAKAKGVWQFMSGTGLENGLKQDWYLDERSNPEKATVAAAKYFKSLYKMFGDWHLAMASYNGGPGRVQRAMKKSGLDDFWTLSATSKYLPRETRDYVPMILAAVIIAKNPVKYGFDVTPLPAPALETVQVPPAVDLRRVAEFAGISADELQRLNPELRRWTTPIRGAGYPLLVPQPAAETVRAKLAAADRDTLNALQWHVVKRGETLTTIARKHRVNRADLAEANYLRVAAPLTAGQKLLIPRMPSSALLARAASGAPVHAALDATPAVFGDTPAEETVIHRVKSGETLYSIARKYQTTVEKLRTLNRLVGSTLRVGARLLIATPQTVATQQQ